MGEACHPSGWVHSVQCQLIIVLSQEHKSKLLMFSALVVSLFLISTLLIIFVKLYLGHRSRSRPRHQARDLDTVSSELDLSVDLQLHESAAAASSSCQTLLTSTKSEFKPKGILKNSRTSENFRLRQNIINIFHQTRLRVDNGIFQNVDHKTPSGQSSSIQGTIQKVMKLGDPL